LLTSREKIYYIFVLLIMNEVCPENQHTILEFCLLISVICFNLIFHCWKSYWRYRWYNISPWSDSLHNVVSIDVQIIVLDIWHVGQMQVQSYQILLCCLYFFSFLFNSGNVRNHICSLSFKTMEKLYIVYMFTCYIYLCLHVCIILASILFFFS